jgi:hypothetical protein
MGSLMFEIRPSPGHASDSSNDENDGQNRKYDYVEHDGDTILTSRATRSGLDVEGGVVRSEAFPDLIGLQAEIG